ncbi:unnamed protein product [Ceutorhynchus assimilis]|uniref:Uncharacterized protein n=1 Tax=Ceutorhynchus assimilis TaxID=467358 RepID=A0A9N9QEP1_9CUCU|nr:unnamed protein product [Ceutorhynchus assimilis]
MQCPDSCNSQQSATGARSRPQSRQENTSRFGYQQAQSPYGQSGPSRQPGYGYQAQSQPRQPGFGYRPQSQPSQAMRQPGFGYQPPGQSGFEAVSQQPPPKPTEQAAKPEEKKKKGLGFQLPPLSIVGAKKEINFDEIRKKVVRQGGPAGEDKKQMAKILKHLKDSKSPILIHEFVSLIAKYTSDNGEIMRQVMEEDLAQFRKMVTKVYENMTQDVSDVLVNEQIQTVNFYKERHDMFNSKMLWMVGEIFQMIPDFDFEKYEKEKDVFLKYVYPLPKLTVRDAEDMELQRRQEAFHRLQWLKIEEGRLAEENKRLEMRLEELKIQHAREQTQSNMKSHIMEDRLQELENEEQQKEKQLKELEHLLGKNIVRTEAFIRLEEDEATRMSKVHPEEIRQCNQFNFISSDNFSRFQLPKFVTKNPTGLLVPLLQWNKKLPINYMLLKAVGRTKGSDPEKGTGSPSKILVCLVGLYKVTIWPIWLQPAIYKRKPFEKPQRLCRKDDRKVLVPECVLDNVNDEIVLIIIRERYMEKLTHYFVEINKKIMYRN